LVPFYPEVNCGAGYIQFLGNAIFVLPDPTP
jgi:hypothetical protein